uniref:ATP synthase F0 subunit 8 n=1 Tax=Funkikonia zheana TaxID=3133676 RepID=A0AAU6PC30_9HEMI
MPQMAPLWWIFFSLFFFFFFFFFLFFFYFVNCIFSPSRLDFKVNHFFWLW